jgi:heat shock protein beta
VDEEEPEDKPIDNEEQRDDAEIKDEEEGTPTEEEPKEKKEKTVTEQVWEWEVINEVKAIWLREKS